MNTLIHIENHHREPPPTWVTQDDPNSRFFYYENRHGEQWVARADRTHFRFSGGDIGWETKECPLADLCNVRGEELGAHFNLVLDTAETLWLASAVLTAMSLLG